MVHHCLNQTFDSSNCLEGKEEFGGLLGTGTGQRNGNSVPSFKMARYAS
jgi:hypothetical protein